MDKSEWLVDGSLVYRINKEGYNVDQIRVDQIDGLYNDQTAKEVAAYRLCSILNLRETSVI